MRKSKKITSTYLKQNTKEVLDVVEDAPQIIYTYGRPKAVLLSFDEWSKKETTVKNPSLKELEKFMYKTKKRTNYAKQIRKDRDEE